MSERYPALEEIDLLWEAEMYRKNEEIEQAQEMESAERERAVRRGER